MISWQVHFTNTLKIPLFYPQEVTQNEKQHLFPIETIIFSNIVLLRVNIEVETSKH